MSLSPRRVFQHLKGRLADSKLKNPHTRKPENATDAQAFRRVPKQRLISRLGLREYDVHPDWKEARWPGREVVLQLRQHVGAPAVPVVKVGDRVERSQLVAEIPAGALGARVHSSITGQVTEVTDRNVRVRGNSE